jgi:hypothetical protein
LYNAYDSTDTRRDGSIINWDKVLGVGKYDQADQRNATGFGWRKYCPLAVSATKTLVESKGGNFMNDNYQDEYIIRYADVLLMAAELHLGDGSGKDLEYVNKVRQRAYKANFVPKTSVTLSEIFEERRLEFALEGIRYWDLLRQGLDVAKSKIEAASGKYPVKFPVESGGFLKIPESQISLSNGSLKQNDYWTTGASNQPAQ